jgi:hypothetical protein
MILLVVSFPDALLGRLAVYSETLSPDSRTSELAYRARDYPLRNFLDAFSYERWPYGYGIGTTALGTQSVAKIIGAKLLGVGAESGFATLVVEMGIGGLLLWFTMAIAIVYSAWRVVLRLPGSPRFPIGFVIFWYALLLLFPLTFAGIQPYEEFILNGYRWLFLGVLLKLPSIKLSAELAAAAKLATRRGRWNI